jgi:hypothetical protein
MIKKYGVQVAAAVLFLSLYAWGVTKITQAAISNSTISSSTINSTTVGAVTPSTGKFTTITATGILPSLNVCTDGSRNLVGCAPVTDHTDHLRATGLCTTTSGTYHTCTSGPFSWTEGGFTDTSYTVVCQVIGPNSSAGADSGFVYPFSKTTTGISLTLQSNAGETFTADEIDCIAHHS